MLHRDYPVKDVRWTYGIVNRPEEAAEIVVVNASANPMG
jgi:hypothetical protein